MKDRHKSNCQFCSFFKKWPSKAVHFEGQRWDVPQPWRLNWGGNVGSRFHEIPQTNDADNT